MRILMLAPEPFFEPRGTPISVYQRLEALSALGHEIDLLTYHVGADIHIANVRVHRIPSVPFVKEVKIGPSWAKPFLDILLFQLAVRKLLARQYDVIHSHEEAAFFAVLLGALFGIPHVYDMHSSLPRQLQNFDVGNWRPLIRLFAWLERVTLRTARAVITIDAELEQYVQTVNPRVRQMRIENCPIPAKRKLVDSDLVRRLKDNGDVCSRQPVVYTGTFEGYQGLDLLLRTAKIVQARNPRALFLLVGGKPHQIEKYRAIALREGVEDAVIFVGIVTPDEAVAFLDLADVLVSPRTDGAFAPLKLYSYLFSGKATVATRIKAHEGVLNDEMALLVEPDEEALAEGILSLLENPEKRRRLGERAHLHALEHHNPAEYAARLEQVYSMLRAGVADLCPPVPGGQLEKRPAGLLRRPTPLSDREKKVLPEA